MVWSMEDLTEQLRRLQLGSQPAPRISTVISSPNRDDGSATSSPTSAIEPECTSAKTLAIASSSDDDSDQQSRTELAETPPDAPSSSPQSALVQPAERGETKLCLLSLPNEILSQILTPLLIHPHTVSIPTIWIDDHPDLLPSPSLSSSVLATCRHLRTVGYPLLYSGNVFNLEPHLRTSFGARYSACTILRPRTRRLIDQLEVQIENLAIHLYLPPIEEVGSVMLNEVVRLYPGKIEYVRSIRCIVDFSYESRSRAMKMLGLSEKWDEAYKKWEAVDRATDPARHRFEYLFQWVNDCLFKWNALLIAGTVKHRCPRFERMYRAGWDGRDGTKKGIVICKAGDLLRRAIRVNKRRGIQFLAELEVDLEKGRVWEVDGKRPGYCY